MKDLMEQFAAGYTADLEGQLDRGHGQRSIQNPVLFLFIGDKSMEALQSVCRINDQKWHNSQGVLYVHAHHEETWEHPQVFGCKLPKPDSENRTMRRDMHERFMQDESLIMDINKLMKQVSIRIAEMGKHFASFQQVNVAVVTRSDDPANILLPDLTLLLKSYLQEMFKNVSTDLYVLLQEKSGGDSFGFSSALGVQFLEEVAQFQRSDYRYQANLMVTGDGIKLPVLHTQASLFSIAYLLSDKTEQGLFLDGGLAENDELISNLVLLNNKEAETAFSESSEGYNKLQFIRSITVDDGRASFATAGLSRVKRPTRAIALTTLAAVFDRYWGRLQEGDSLPKTKAREKLGLTAHDLQRMVSTVLPDEDILMEMNGLMTSGVSYGELGSMNLREAELALFDGNSQSFFESHFVHPARRQMDSLVGKTALADVIQREIIEDERYGLYAAFQLTSEVSSGANLLDELRTGIKETQRQLEQAKAELDDIYYERVEQQELRVGGFFTRDKERVRTFVRHLFAKVYNKKAEILEWELTLQLLLDYEQQAKQLHKRIGEQVEQLEGLQKELRAIAQKSVKEAADYLGKNMDEYYESVVTETIRSQEAQRGSGFYLDGRYIGDGSLLFQHGISGLLERLCAFCRTEILTRSPFSLSFEAELLARANVGAAYDNRTVLTKEDLFQDLSLVLEERAAVHAEVFHFLQKHRYEEKYWFADLNNDFVQYVLREAEGTRTYKQGCIHEARKSGIEKMNLMGGFGLEDLMYYRNNKKYHSSYVESGYVFHRQGKEELS
ncbi:hypothetical protein [Brevibacillus choshinensis]|uniref:Transcription initiation factor TFIID n=1 Tax=Brevibacillus choshinensis TaxID=54911 RepID=A0ABX7FPL5_BRECH|nr:hypothetical protein [Brevibacillus choshinensis]QRG67599.1 hypothetical protein JNE38_29950 [Brevibacillus choshinensis]